MGFNYPEADRYPEIPTGWEREFGSFSSLDPGALSHWTYIDHDDVVGPELIMKHTGEVQLTAEKQWLASDGGRERELRIYKGLQYDFDFQDGDPGNDISATSRPGERIFFKDGKQVRREEVLFDLETSAIMFSNLRGVPFSVGVHVAGTQRSLDITSDTAGRVSALELSSPEEDDTLKIGIDQRAPGTIDRELSSNWTITRRVFDPRGRMLGRYVGTNDRHPFWGNEDVDPGGNYDDNLLLKEWHQYGTGTRDAGLIVRSQQYREEHPQNYPDVTNPVVGYFPSGKGAVSEYRYDWQGRRVVTTSLKSDGSTTTPYRHSFTFRNAVGDVVLRATYGPTPPVGTISGTSGCLTVDRNWADTPPTFQYCEFTPSAVEALQAEPPPLSVVEYKYNARGEVESTREYDVADDSGSSYKETLTYYNDRSDVSVSIGPSGLRSEYTYDAKGRLVQESRYSGDESAGTKTELTRVISEYDDQDNPISTVSYDRVHNSGVGLIQGANSTWSAAYNWYNLGGGLTTTAIFGSSSVTGGGEHVIMPRPVSPPYWNWEGGEMVLHANNLPDEARITEYTYNNSGQVQFDVSPLGVENAYFYNGWGKIRAIVENTKASDASKKRVTYFEYDEGRLRQIAVLHQYDPANHIDPIHNPTPTPFEDLDISDLAELIDWDDIPDGEFQVSLVRYGADIVSTVPEADGQLATAVSRDNELIGGFVLPDPVNGKPKTGIAPSTPGDGPILIPPDDENDKDYPDAPPPPDPDGGPDQEYINAFTFQYYSDGSLATRTDARGVTLKHYYNERGQRIKTIVDQPAIIDGAFDVYADWAVDQVEYAYEDTHGLLAVATSYTEEDAANGNARGIVSDAEFDYDDRGRLIRAWQHPGGDVDRGATALSPHTGYTWDALDRLVSIRYPAPYGETPPEGAEPRSLDYVYGSGSGSADYGNARVTRIEDDTFGIDTAVAGFAYTGGGARVAFNRGESGTGSNVYTVTQSFGDGSSGYAGLTGFGEIADLHFKDGLADTILRYQYAYNDLGQRRYEQITQKDPDPNDAISYDNARSSLYNYDGLNRLIGAEMGMLNAAADGIDPSQLLGGTTREFNWDVDSIGNRTMQQDLVSEQTNYILNSLNQVTSTSEHPIGDNTNPLVTQNYHDEAGNLVFDGTHYYQYDAWNRLVQIKEAGTLYVDPADGQLKYTTNWAGIGGPGATLRRYGYDALGRLTARRVKTLASETIDREYRLDYFFYDGARRIVDATVYADFWREWVQGEEDNFDEGDGSGSGGHNPIGGIGYFQSGTDYLNIEREYIYTPHGVDELIAQIDRDNNYWWTLQDPTGDVVGLVDEGGVLARQYSYDPFGTVIYSEKFADHPVSEIGHQGLLFERLDAHGDAEPLTQLAHGIYHNRNRTYMPSTGRFLQMDPNATFRQVAGTGYSGGVDPISALSFDMESLFGDGFGLYGAYNHDPVNGSDPSGLMDVVALAQQGNYGIFRGQMHAIRGLENLPPNDPFNAVVDYVTESVAAQAAYLGQLQQGFDAAASIAISVASLHPAVGAGLAIYQIASGEGDLWTFAELGGPAGKILGKSLRLFRKTTRAYKPAIIGCVSDFARESTRRCIFEGSMIMTPEGEVPIEQLEVGDLVLSRLDEDPDSPNIFMPISAITQNPTNHLLCVRFDDGLNLYMTVDHAIWTEEAGWILAEDLQVGSAMVTAQDDIATVCEVQDLYGHYWTFDLTIEHTASFFVNGIWVHNGCRLVPKRIVNLAASSAGNIGGAGYMSPDGVAYLHVQHGLVFNELKRLGKFDANGPKTAGWITGFLSETGEFVGDVWPK